MKERFLFNRVGTDGRDVAVFKGIKMSANIPTSGTEASISLKNQAAPFAGMTLHLVPKNRIE